MTKADPRSNVASARYANYFRVGHNAVEFVMDFGESYDEQGEAFHTRIVTSPRYAEDLLEVLRKSLREYKRTFGDSTGEESPSVDSAPSET